MKLDIHYMEVVQKPFNNPQSPYTIKGIVEVVLDNKVWKKIFFLKNKNSHLTYSWITRYCVFKLSENPNFHEMIDFVRLREKMKNSQLINNEESQVTHRHKICFYGNDEAYLKKLSAEIRISMSVIIRIALELYLPELYELISVSSLEVEEVQLSDKLFQVVKSRGTKVVQQINLSWEKTYKKFRRKLNLDFLLFSPMEIT